MSIDREHPTSRAGSPTFEDAVRGALRRRARAWPNDRSTGPAGDAVKLRRWSVAELIARAVPRPPADGAAH